MILISILFFHPAKSEANPAVIVSGAIAYGAALLFAAGVQYTVPLSHYQSYIDNSGSFGRIAQATWNIIGDYGSTLVQNKLVTAKISFTDMLNAVVSPFRSNPGASPYPNLFNLLADGLVTDINSGSLANHTYTVPGLGGQRKKIISISTYQEGCNSSSPNIANDTLWQSGGSSTCPDTHTVTTAYLQSGEAPIPPVVDKSISQVTSSPEALSGLGDVYSGEIDDLIKSQPNIVHFVDTMNPDQDLSTAPPFVPTNVVTAPPTTTVPVRNAATSAQSAAQTASQNLITAQTAANNYWTAHPTAARANDPAYATLLDAVDAASRASVAADSLSDTVNAEANLALPDAKADVLKLIDFSPLLSLQGVLAGKFPFSLLDSITIYLNPFLGAPSAPSFTVPMPLGNSITVDLSCFDIVATMCRFVISSLMLLGVSYFVVRRYTD